MKRNKGIVTSNLLTSAVGCRFKNGALVWQQVRTGYVALQLNEVSRFTHAVQRFRKKLYAVPCVPHPETLPMIFCDGDSFDEPLGQNGVAAKQLLTFEKLGDRKPIELLRSMEQLLGDKAGTMDVFILEELFLQRLL